MRCHLLAVARHSTKAPKGGHSGVGCGAEGPCDRGGTARCGEWLMMLANSPEVACSVARLSAAVQQQLHCVGLVWPTGNAGHGKRALTSSARVMICAVRVISGIDLVSHLLPRKPLSSRNTRRPFGQRLERQRLVRAWSRCRRVTAIGCCGAR